MYMTINAKLCTCIGEYVKKKKIFLSQSNSLYIQVYILFNMKKKIITWKSLSISFPVVYSVPFAWKVIFIKINKK